MLRIELARADYLMADNFTVKKYLRAGNSYRKYPLVSKQENKTPSILTQKTLEIRSNLIEGAEKAQERRQDKKTSSNTGMHKERQGKAQIKMHKRNETNATKHSKETQGPNNNVHSI